MSRAASSSDSIQTILYSLMSLPNVDNAIDRLRALSDTLILNEVEKQIIKVVETQYDMHHSIDANYVYTQFNSYFTSFNQAVHLPEDQIDTAILSRKMMQEKSDLGNELLKLSSDLDGLTSLEIKDRFEKLRGLTELTQTKVGDIPNGLKKLDNAYEALTSDAGIYSLGLPEVERHAGKIGKGHVVSVLAYVGSFKSTYSLNIAYENAMQGHNVLYISLESTDMSMISRMVLNHIASTVTSASDLISQDLIREKKLSPKQEKFYNDKHNELVDKAGNNLILWDSVNIKYNTFYEMTQTLRTADEMFKKQTGRGLDILVMDQLSLLKYTSGSGQKHSYAGAVMDDWMTYFRKQSLNFLDSGQQIASVIVSQVRREAYAEASKTKNKGRYDASCGGDSNEIERTSDTMITLYKDLDLKDTLLVHIPKARHGSIPDKPIQTEVNGAYFKVGEMKIANTMVGADYLDNESVPIDFADLL